MPGREDLIQQNRAAVRARIENAGEQASGGGEKQVYSSHRSLLGGNLDVASALESIEFAVSGPLGDGALRNSVAYIRYWNRAGSKATAEAAAQTVDATQLDPAADSQAQIHQQIRENYLLPKTLVESSAADYLSDTYTYRDIRANERVGDSFTSGKLGSEVGVQSDTIPDTGIDPNTGYRPSGSDSLYANGWDAQTVQVDSKPQKDRQDALSTEIPRINNNYTFSKTDLNTSFDPNLNLDLGTTINPRTSGVGQLKPANPNGFVNTISRIGRSVLGIPPSQIGYSGAAGAPQGGKASVSGGGTLSKGMWQFLFNPSELEIEAGPEFKAAETWGVSDKGNSGQPLNWSHNKNTQLKFNSVLLNGFVFGRKVEELEQGIFELFMARDGQGQAGPPILEFVWGKRVFGPCVIKDISIKEKMWDEGMVVNAELSFTLEQIPEWTINDGYVDVARPGKIPMVYDATNPSGTAPGTTPGATSQSDTPPGGGGASPDQKSTGQGGLTPTELYQKCQRAGVYAEQFYQIQQKSHQGGFSTGTETKTIVINVRGEYNTLYNKALADLGSELTSRSTYPNADSRKLIVSTDISIKSEDAKTGLNAITRNYSAAMSMIQNAADSSRQAAKQFSTSPTCVAERQRVDKVTKDQKTNADCQKKQPGNLCSSVNVSPGQRINTCSGVTLICGADGYLKNASIYRP